MFRFGVIEGKAIMSKKAKQTAIVLSQQMLDAPYMRLAAMLLIAKTSNPPLFDDVDAASMLTMLAEEATGSIPAGVYYYVGGQ
mgnify:CR=1 FL=1